MCDHSSKSVNVKLSLVQSIGHCTFAKTNLSLKLCSKLLQDFSKYFKHKNTHKKNGSKYFQICTRGGYVAAYFENKASDFFEESGFMLVGLGLTLQLKQNICARTLFFRWKRTIDQEKAKKENKLQTEHTALTFLTILEVFLFASRFSWRSGRFKHTIYRQKRESNSNKKQEASKKKSIKLKAKKGTKIEQK